MGFNGIIDGLGEVYTVFKIIPYINGKTSVISTFRSTQELSWQPFSVD